MAYRDNFINDVNNLSDDEREEIIDVAEAITKRYDAEANKESQLKWRILFERTAPEMLPFVIYCIYMGSVAIYAFVNINKYSGSALFIYLGVLLAVMILPIFVLPNLPFKKWFSREKKKGEEKDKIQGFN
jgi:hypothetical protein